MTSPWTSPGPDAVMTNLRSCIAAGVHCVVGTTGFTDDRLAEVRSMLADAPGVGVLIAPNFSVGGRADDAVRRAGRAVLPRRSRSSSSTTTARSMRRRAPRPHGPSGSPPPAHGRCGPVPDATTDERRAPAAPTSTGCACTRSGWRAGRPPGGAVRHRGARPSHPARLARPRLVHARRAAGGALGRRPARA